MADTVCISCQVPFVPGVNSHGSNHKYCLVCFRARSSVKLNVPGTVPGPIVSRPTEKALAKARAMVAMCDSQETLSVLDSQRLH